MLDAHRTGKESVGCQKGTVGFVDIHITPARSKNADLCNAVGAEIILTFARAVGPECAAFSLGLWNHCVTLPRRETSVQSSRLSGSDEVEIRIMGCGHLRLGVVNYQLTKVEFILSALVVFLLELS
jgi:hypothetical protein